MSIKVLYFANLKELVGRSSDEIQTTEALSARAIWLHFHPDLPIPNTLLAAVNMDYISLDTLVQDGSELAFFPPVTGG